MDEKYLEEFTKNINNKIEELKNQSSANNQELHNIKEKFIEFKGIASTIQRLMEEVQKSLDERVTKIEEQNGKITIAVFGIDENNGLRKDMLSVKKRLGNLENWSLATKARAGLLIAFFVILFTSFVKPLAEVIFKGIFKIS